MTKVAAVLRILAIVVNAILCVLVTTWLIAEGSSGGDLVLLGLVVLTTLLNVLMLSFARLLITGRWELFWVCIASVLNGCSLVGVILGLSRYGMPGAVVANIAVLIWLVFPPISLPALFMVRLQLKKGIPCEVVVCPNCGTEIQR